MVAFYTFLVDEAHGHFGDILSIIIYVVFVYADRRGDFADILQLCFVGDFNIGFHCTDILDSYMYYRFF